MVATARRLAARPTAALGLIRRGLLACLNQGLTETLGMAEYQRIAGRTADHAEGGAAGPACGAPPVTVVAGRPAALLELREPAVHGDRRSCDVR